MKGSLVHAIIASLDDRARKRFLSSWAGVKDWDHLAQLFLLLANQPTYSETDLLGKLEKTKRIKNHRLERLGQMLISFMGEGNMDVLVFQIVSSVPFLVENSQDKQAIELIEWGISLAEQTENYHGIQALWRLAEIFPEPRPHFKGMSYEHALACAANLVAYRQLEVRLRQTPMIEQQEERLAALAEIEESSLLESPGMALGYEARLLYWRIKAACKYLVKNYKEAVGPQSTLAEILQERREEGLDFSRRWIREMGSLAVVLGLSGQIEAFKQVLDEIHKFPMPSIILEREKVKQLYPVMITVAADSGDAEFAENSCAAALSLMGERPKLFFPSLQCHVLFQCARFYLMTNRFSESAKIMMRLRGFPKSSFRMPYIFATTKVLEIIQEIEEGSYEDAIRLCKNLRMSKHDQQVPGINIAIQLLSLVATSLCEPQFDWNKTLSLPSILKLSKQLKGQSIIDFFDLFAWMDAKKTNRSMIAVLHQMSSEKL